MLWWQLGPRLEGLGCLRRFLDPAPARLRLRALLGAGWLTFWLDDQAVERAHVREGLALAEQWNDERMVIAFLFQSAGWQAEETGLDDAQAVAERGLALAHQLGEPAGAAARYQEALAVPGYQSEQWAQRNLGYLTLETWQPHVAAACIREALAEVWGRCAYSAVLETLLAFAALSGARGEWERAARLLGAADAGVERLGGVLPEIIGQQERELTLAATRGRLSEPALAAGRALPLEQAVAEALAADGG